MKHNIPSSFLSFTFVQSFAGAKKSLMYDTGSPHSLCWVAANGEEDSQNVEPVGCCVPLHGCEPAERLIHKAPAEIFQCI
jgi:hypothetical protein